MRHLSIFVLLAVCASASTSLRSACAQGPPDAATVIVVPVVQREVAAGQTFVGAVVPWKKSVIGSAVDGRVVELFINDGDAVGRVETEDGSNRGEPIAQLLTDTISIDIEAARAEMQLRKQELAELEAGSRPEEIAQAKARLGATKALMDFATSRFQRTKSLFEQGKTTSQEEFEESLSAALAAEQNHIAAQAAYDLAVEGPRKEKIEQARAQLAAATERVNRLESQKTKYTIRAPFEGYVTEKLTEVGAWVSRGDPVAEVIALDPIEVDVTVPEQYITHVRRGATVNVQADALPDRTFTGTVARIVPQADLRSRTFPVKIRLANPKQDGGHLLKAGMLAHVTITVGPAAEALLVPKDALVLGGLRPLVMAVVRDERQQLTTVRSVPVTLGVAEGSLIQVTGDLQPGQHVVVVGNERVRPGQTVDPVLQDTSPAPPSAGE